MAACPKIRDRSLARIEVADLLRLAALAADAEAELLRRNPQGSVRYVGRLLGRALYQGAALHYADESNGAKDFDAWSFYAQLDNWPFPVGAENLCHRAIFVDDATGAVMPLDPEMIQVGDAVWQRP